MMEDTWTEYAASYALGALDPDERTAFEAHLAGCASCQLEVKSYQEVVTGLAMTSPARTAPAGLRERVLRDARAARPSVTQPTEERKAGRNPSWLAMAASIIVAIGSAVMFVSERQARRAAESNAEQNEVRLAETQNELSRADSLIAVMLAPDLQTASLTAEGKPPSARVFYNRARNVVVIAARDLQPAPDGRTYQLWGIADGKPVSLGTFNTNQQGQAVTALSLPSAPQFELTAVTEEPAGGSPQPTTTPFLVGTFRAQ
jgi:anti-sigma-K factor RskA